MPKHKWYCPIESLTFIRLWDETGTIKKTYHSRLAVDKHGIKRSEEDLIKRLYLESKENWKTAITYDNKTKAQRTKWVDKVRVE